MSIVGEIIAEHPETISTLVNITQMKYILDNFYSVIGVPGDVALNPITGS